MEINIEEMEAVYHFLVNNQMAKVTFFPRTKVVLVYYEPLRTENGFPQYKDGSASQSRALYYLKKALNDAI